MIPLPFNLLDNLSVKSSNFPQAETTDVSLTRNELFADTFAKLTPSSNASSDPAGKSLQTTATEPASPLQDMVAHEAQSDGMILPLDGKPLPSASPLNPGHARVAPEATNVLPRTSEPMLQQRVTAYAATGAGIQSASADPLTPEQGRVMPPVATLSAALTNDTLNKPAAVSAATITTETLTTEQNRVGAYSPVLRNTGVEPRVIVESALPAATVREMPQAQLQSATAGLMAGQDNQQAVRAKSSLLPPQSEATKDTAPDKTIDRATNRLNDLATALASRSETLSRGPGDERSLMSAERSHTSQQMANGQSIETRTLNAGNAVMQKLAAGMRQAQDQPAPHQAAGRLMAAATRLEQAEVAGRTDPLIVARLTAMSSTPAQQSAPLAQQPGGLERTRLELLKAAPLQSYRSVSMSNPRTTELPAELAVQASTASVTVGEKDAGQNAPTSALLAPASSVNSIVNSAVGATPAATANPANAPLPEDIHNQVMRVIADRRVGQSRVSVQLNPASLGSLEINFAKDAEGEVSITIIAREQATRDFLDQLAPRVRQMLTDSGVNLGQLDVRSEREQQSAEEHKQLAEEQHLSPADEDTGADDADATPHEQGFHIAV